MTYTEKLKDPRWQKRRLEKMQAASWRCESCGEFKKELHVHHIRYRNGREPWEYALRELKCLCCDCHGEKHGRRIFRGLVPMRHNPTAVPQVLVLKKCPLFPLYKDR